MSAGKNKESDFDLRTVNRKIAKNEVCESGYSDYLKSLDDSTDNAVVIDIEDEDVADIDDMPVSDDYVD
jgi:hypothetical protein